MPTDPTTGHETQERRWSVTVRRNGDDVVTLEPRMLAGRDISPLDEQAIRRSAHALLAFIGDPPPQVGGSDAD